jgi:phosphate transport system substrate-binding protein
VTHISGVMINVSNFISRSAALAAILFVLAFASCKERIMVQVDGSSTVYPITEAVASEFQKEAEDVHVTVGISGTGGGFKKFCSGRTDISNASRVIKQDEVDKCEAAGIEFIEVPVAYDGLAVLVNPANEFVDQLTVDELRKIFQLKDPALTWQDIRADWPAEEIEVYAPGKSSGTFDYFIEAIIGKGGQIRSDALFSEDDNTLVRGISGDKNGIGFFGYAYYEENQDDLKVVPIVNPRTNQAVAPSIETVKTGTYSPLSRPLLIYVALPSAQKEHVRTFVTYYLGNVGTLAREAGYIPLSAEAYENIKRHYEALETGSVLMGIDLMGKPVENLYAN